jgi:hypothetical protein
MISKLGMESIDCEKKTKQKMRIKLMMLKQKRRIKEKMIDLFKK